MRKFISLAVCALICAALAVTAFAASQAPDLSGKKLDVIFTDNFETVDNWDMATPVQAIDGKLVLGQGESWIQGGYTAVSKEKYENCVIEFELEGDGRDCYYGFGLRVPTGDTNSNLQNGGRFNVPQAAEISTGIAVDTFGAGNSALNGEAIGITFCNGAANGDAPAFTVANPDGYDGKANAKFKVVDLGDVITIYVNDKELTTIKLSGLADGSYGKATAYKADGTEIGSYDVTVLEKGGIAFYQRNDLVKVGAFKVSSVTDNGGSSTPEEQPSQPSTTPPTADASVIAIAAVACVAFAGVVIAKKVR